MRRREFITLLGGAAAAWPLAARAQQQPVPVIGWFSGRNLEADALVLPAFKQGLNAHGYVEGRNVTIEYAFADGRYDQLPILVAELIRRRAAVIVAVGNSAPGIRAAQAASTTIPTVFIFGEDPVKFGLVPNLNRPGGNSTGVANLLRELAPKRLGILHELLPRATSFAVLVNPANIGGLDEAAAVQNAARAIGRPLRMLNASTESELGAAFAAVTQMRPDALFVLSDPFFFARAHQIVEFAARLAIPASYHRREFAVAGGLISYGSNADDNYRVLGDYAGRILKGERAGDLPVQLPTKFELVINLKTAKALGLTIPPMLLALADQVIE
jgi:putative ABC transport system substrate-binding protein